MKDADLNNLSFPARSDSVFEKIVWLDWYDGMTGGLVVPSRIPGAFKLDILAWGPGQQRRIFALSPFDLREFDRVVALLSENAPPTWPKWDPEWPSGTPEKEDRGAQIARALRTAGIPKYVLSSDAFFETIYGLKLLGEEVRDLLPREFNGVPFRDNFDYWQQYLGA